MKLWLTLERKWGYVTRTIPSDKWQEEEDQITLCDIGLMVDPSLYVHINDAKTAKAAWDTLHEAFSATGVSGRFGLMRRLYAVRLETFESISSYLNEIMSLTQQLQEVGKTIDYEDTAFIMLNGQTEKYKPLATALEATLTMLTSQKVKEFLLGQEQLVFCS